MWGVSRCLFFLIIDHSQRISKWIAIQEDNKCFIEHDLKCLDKIPPSCILSFILSHLVDSGPEAYQLSPLNLAGLRKQILATTESIAIG